MASRSTRYQHKESCVVISGDRMARVGSSAASCKCLGPWKLNSVHNVDCLAGLHEVPDDVLDVTVTSPPYWGQRGHGGLGSEEDPREYVAKLVEILAETMRCMKPSGTLWLNIADSYNTPINWTEDDYHYSTLGEDRQGFDRSNSAYSKNRGRRRAFVDKNVGYLRYGNLLGIPYRVVLGLTERGFLFRGEIIWNKVKPMPEGLCRRPHRRHEGIYIIAKDERHSFRKKPPVGSVWNLKQTPNMTAHTSTFPLDLPIECIRAAAIEGRGIVFDPFMGSGTTARAAVQTERNYLGSEISKEYHDICVKRLEVKE